MSGMPPFGRDVCALTVSKKRECDNYPWRKFSGVHFGPGSEHSSEPTVRGRGPWHLSGSPLGSRQGYLGALCTADCHSRCINYITYVSRVAGICKTPRPNEGLFRLLLVLWFFWFPLVRYCLSTYSQISFVILNFY